LCWFEIRKDPTQTCEPNPNPCNPAQNPKLENQPKATQTHLKPAAQPFPRPTPPSLSPGPTLLSFPSRWPSPLSPLGPLTTRSLSPPQPSALSPLRPARRSARKRAPRLTPLTSRPHWPGLSPSSAQDPRRDAAPLLRAETHCPLPHGPALPRARPRPTGQPHRSPSL